MRTPKFSIKSNATLLAFLLISLATLTFPNHSYSAGAIKITKAWLRATPPSAMAAGGYLVITNNTGKDDTLIGVEFSQAGTSEIHEMTMNDGVMKMRPLRQGINIPAGDSISLKPGGFHLMFMGMKSQLKEGQNYTIKLTFTHSGVMDIDFPVLSLGKGKKLMTKED